MKENECMKEYLRKVMASDETGLFLCELPTGFGKTYTASQLIAEFVRNDRSGRKIIYLTTLNKNLPEDELRAALGETEYEKYVLRIRANFDEVVEKIIDIEVPEEFQTEDYHILVKTVQTYNKLLKHNGRDKEYKALLEERIRNADSSFRKMIRKMLSDAFKTKQERLEAIRSSKKFKWIGKLYPAVFTDAHRILLMSVNKFLLRNSVLVEPSYEMIKAPFLKNAIIFIDEFDATKATVKDEVIKRSLEMKNDFLVLFRQICRMMDSSHMSRKMKDACDKVKTKDGKQNEFEVIAQEAREIAQIYHTNLSYKTEEGSIDRRQNFLLKDSSFHTVLQGDKRFVRAQLNPAENIVDIRFEDKEHYYAEHEEHDVVIYGLIRRINSFLQHFRNFLFEWARHYCNAENEYRGDNRDMMTIENAVNSILDKIELSKKQRELLLGEMCDPFVKGKEDDVIPSASFFQDGFEVYEFEDNDAHNDSTSISYVKVYDTPEKFMIYLSQMCKVIGISATAEIPTVVGNYNLSYLKESLGERFHATPQAVKERIRSQLAPNYRAYHDGRIKIEADVYSNDYNGKELSEICREITGESEISQICENLITAQSVERYQSIRYCNVFRAILAFCRRPFLRSMLYLGMALPKQDHPDFDEDLLKKLMKLALDLTDNPSDQASLDILRSENFEEEKGRLSDKLTNGEKVFIMSSYSTIGAGQNLQYKVVDPQKSICLRECDDPADKRFLTKDIDALYLGDATNLTVNTYGEDTMDSTSLMKMLFQIEELYSNGELSFDEKDSMIRHAFHRYSGRRESDKNCLYYKDSVKMQATKHVIQAVGRMCRTFLKSPEILIIAEEKLIEKVSAGEINKRVIPPEMACVEQLCENVGTHYTNEEQKILNNAERISTIGMQTIRSLLSHRWSEKSMEAWKNLRETVLRYPTASAEDRLLNATVRKLYITSGEKQNGYLYSQYSDFSNVTLDFTRNEAGFRESSRAKHRSDTGEVAVFRMNEAESGLTIAMKNHTLNAFFRENGYATAFDEQEYLMSPVLFHNIFKGALGEVCGKVLLQQKAGITLNEIDDPERFEFFDYAISDGVYVDFKNWKTTYRKDRQKSLKEISRKLDAIGGKRVYIVNLIGDPGWKPTVTHDGKIIEIPGLIDKNGQVLSDNLRMIKEENHAFDESL